MRLAEILKLLTVACAAHALCGPARAATPAIAANSDFTLALSSTGKVYAWGWDTRGQLGSGRTVFRATAQKIAGLPPIVHMEGGKVHVAAADSSGNVWTWGQDTSGQLGPRSARDWTRPARVQGITGVVQVVASQSFTAALKSDGTVWVWGVFAQQQRPLQQVQGFTGITSISAGGGHIIGRRNDGTVWAAGTNTYGELGDGTSGNVRTTAYQVPLPLSPTWTKVASGQCTSIALHSTGAVYAWGLAGCASGTPRLSPAPVVVGSSLIADIHGGFHYSHVVLTDGTVRYWDSTYTVATRSELTGISQLVADSVFDTVARRTNGTVAVTGLNDVGQHGQGNTTPIGGVSTVTGLSGITRVATVVSGNGGTTNLALAGNGDLYAWGSDFEGQLGAGSTLLTSVPKEVAGLPAIEKIAAGELAAYAVDASGNAWAWGDNSGFALGDTTNTPRSTPVMVAGLTGVKDVAAGRRFALFLMNDGTVRQLGSILGLPSAYSPPATVSGLTGMTAVFAHQQNAFAIRTTGTPAVYSWGRGLSGLLGDNTTADRATPGLVTAFDSTVTHVAVSEFHALARSADGAVWSWGSDAGSGTLGSGTAGNQVRLVPARVAGVTGATHVAAGYTHSLARLASGQVMSWGATALGDGPNESRSVPGPVRTLVNAASISAGYYSSHAMGADGVVTAWGGRPLRTTQHSTFGASTGDGTFVYRPAPVLVLRDSALGNLDSNDWYLDLNAAAANSIPAVLLPKVVPVARATLAPTVVSLEAGINFRNADNGKKVKTFVLGYVPPSFLALAGIAPGMSKARVEDLVKAGNEVLVQLTPNGWFTVEGQLVAYATGVVAGNGAANGILDGVPIASIPGARFCIGYGEDAASMLSAGTLGDVLTLEGAASSALGVPCVLSGVYVDGPATSIAGSTVTFNASVVGFAPSGSVQFTNNVASLGAPAFLAAANSAVSKASITTASLGAGPHSIGATYGGDGANAAASAEFPLMHQVNAAAPGSASIALSGPISSEAGVEVAFLAVVTGNNPGGTVQFRDGAANLGAPQALVGGTATLRTSSLALGPHSIDAAYGGDSGNAAAVSNFVSHVVYGAINTSVSLASNANPAAYGAGITLTATVTGSNPTGIVTFRNGAAALATVALSGGVAGTTVTGLAPGAHVLTATYNGDATNQAVTSSGLYQQVNAQAPNTVPNPFGFAPVLNAPPGSTVTSNAITVSGLGTTVPIVVAGGSYSIGCTATFTAAAGTIGNTQTVCVRHSASASNSATTFTTLTIGGVSATFTSTTYSASFLAGVSATVAHYYQSILGRAPDSGGAAFWQGEALRVSGLGASVNEAFYSLAATFYVSPEYAAFNRNNTGFATDLYNTFFDRAPDAGGLAFWVGQLDAGMPREVTLASFMFSPEFAAYTQGLFGSTSARAEVNTVMDFYRGLLARLPDDGGFSFWVGRFRVAQCQGTAAVTAEVEAISSAFTLSGEYAARNRSNTQYVGDLYNGFLRRGGDLAGVQSWIAQLDSGALTREQLRVAFKNSAEFAARVNAIIAQGCL